MTADSATASTCWTASLAGDAEISAHLHVFHFIKLNPTYSKEFGEHKLAGTCHSPIVFDGKPDTKAPPPTLGPYDMKSFAADTSAEGTTETQLTGPTGKLKFDTALTHDLIGSDWQTWSNGYDGDVYESSTPLSDGSFEIIVTLPPGTGAFYAYAEPDLFQDFDMSASAEDGPSSHALTVEGDSGARYFGFYAHCGHTIHAITFTDSDADEAMAIGEFGIARASACKATASTH